MKKNFKLKSVPLAAASLFTFAIVSSSYAQSNSGAGNDSWVLETFSSVQTPPLGVTIVAGSVGTYGSVTAKANASNVWEPYPIQSSMSVSYSCWYVLQFTYQMNGTLPLPTELSGSLTLNSACSGTLDSQGSGTTAASSAYTQASGSVKDPTDSIDVEMPSQKLMQQEQFQSLSIGDSAGTNTTVNWHSTTLSWTPVYNGSQIVAYSTSVAVSGPTTLNANASFAGFPMYDSSSATAISAQRATYFSLIETWQ